MVKMKELYEEYELIYTYKDSIPGYSTFEKTTFMGENYLLGHYEYLYYNFGKSSYIDYSLFRDDVCGTLMLTPLEAHFIKFAPCREAVTDLILCQYQKNNGNPIKHSQTHSICPPNYYTCESGECIYNARFCDGQPDCRDNSDEFDCPCTMHTRTSGYHGSADIQFCTEGSKSLPLNKRELFHFCGDRLAIYKAHVCDGEINCVDGSDEYFCEPNSQTNIYNKGSPAQNIQCGTFGQVTSNESVPATLWNDLMPDCPNLADEQNYIYMKSPSGYTTADIGTDPCPSGHEACYPFYNVCFQNKFKCVYDKDANGNLKYCRNGAHIYECSNALCSSMFRCQEYYCIPWRLVCDGVHDCPYGSDEQSCHTYTCRGMLYCRTTHTCIHPTEMCDGEINCSNGEDEAQCNLPQTPPQCVSVGHAYTCSDKMLRSFPVLVTGNEVVGIKVLILNKNKLELKINTLDKFTELVELDVSINKLDLQRPVFRKLHVLKILNVSYNAISSVNEASFHGLNNLYQLYLTGNNIAFIAPKTFTRPFSIKQLNLSQLKLSHISSHAIGDIESIDLSRNNLNVIADILIDVIYINFIDISYNPITKIEMQFFFKIVQVE